MTGHRRGTGKQVGPREAAKRRRALYRARLGAARTPVQRVHAASLLVQALLVRVPAAVARQAEAEVRRELEAAARRLEQLIEQRWKEAHR